MKHSKLTLPEILIIGFSLSVLAAQPLPREREIPLKEAAQSVFLSRSGRMYLFPAVTPGTAVAFHNFQARGGFLVSAAKDAQEVYFLEVQPRREKHIPSNRNKMSHQGGCRTRPDDYRSLLTGN